MVSNTPPPSGKLCFPSQSGRTVGLGAGSPHPPRIPQGQSPGSQDLILLPSPLQNSEGKWQPLILQCR